MIALDFAPFGLLQNNPPFRLNTNGLIERQLCCYQSLIDHLIDSSLDNPFR